MHQITREQITKVLREVGIGPGDGLLVHSALQYLGRPVGGVRVYYAALCEILDNGSGRTGEVPLLGTVAVPTFNFAFARGERYDPANTPSEGMGSFSEFVRTLPGALRTSHPMQSLAVVGHYAAELSGLDTPSAFDPGSVFERMLELDFKLLLLGADVQAVSMLHYSEQRAKVPYRFWKDFKGEIRTSSGWSSRTYRMYVRELELDPQLQLYPIQEMLMKRGQWSSLPINYGNISSCRLVDFVAATDKLLASDPWSLVANRPHKA